MNVDDLLAAYLDEQIHEARKLDDSYSVLWAHIKELVLRGGKRTRPRLVMETYKKYGGEDLVCILPVAAAWEMLHVGLLIHDDIMDGDFERRGEPNIAGIYGDNNVALLAGDLCLGSANDLILNASLKNSLKIKILQLLQGIYKEVTAGQLLDIDSHKHDPLLVARYKTASYSFVGPMISGAMMAGATDDNLLVLREVGIKHGIAYQLQNDLEDVEQDTAPGPHSTVIQAMDDLGSLDEARAAIRNLIIKLAEREGFEPSMELLPYRLSKAAH